ncbi:hypothetical protein H1D32_10175 [Anaerobacillus sp. CMMVII]|uniref:PGDYG domain-containing protein n=1 Tax=Anaerobacillus sp. CMMVII TaxID=2755588 RepID=UPI0021B82F74|nr:PGDYG domain-containing protein [Anaerobacillus sp. CMMVII]MCT8138087.1 hypothetical protein [Anaerobacillus sp. CMMVII]
MMPKYRRKPLVVEAVKITSPITIQTAEGKMSGNAGDYLITQSDGAQYPVNAETFEQTYEPVKTYTDAKNVMYRVLRKLKRKLITGEQN